MKRSNDATIEFTKLSIRRKGSDPDLLYDCCPENPSKDISNPKPCLSEDGEEGEKEKKCNCYWEPGQELTWCLINNEKEGPSNRDVEVIQQAFNGWSEICYIKFKKLEDNDMDAMIRIGFDKNCGCMSYLGKDILNRKYCNQKTMNFGFPLFGRKFIALHEIGHALGFSHEHQQPNSGIVWNTEVVYEYYFKSYGWDKDTVNQNILNKVEGVPNHKFDPDSIMNYGIEPFLIIEPSIYRDKGIPEPSDFSPSDRELAQQIYPFPRDRLNESISYGQMRSFKLLKDEIKTVRVRRPIAHTQFRITTLVPPDEKVEMILKCGTEIIAGTSNSNPLTFGGDEEECILELKCISSPTLTATIVIPANP
jgi:hypothetical protein